MNHEHIQLMRRFNRMLTLRLGVLNENYLSSGRPLGEARLLFEIGPAGATVRELRLRMALDSGYLSRMLRMLETEKLLTRRRDSQDGRVQRVMLTPSGLQVWQELDQRSNERIDSLLTPLSDRQRGRLLMAVGEVERYLRAAAVTIAPADPASPEAQACIHAYFQELAQRFTEGFDPALSVSAEPEELTPPSGYFHIATLDSTPVGCGGVKIADGGYGEIKRMWVAPAARGLGIAQRLLATLETQAAAAGVQTLRLDTHRSLTEACALYARNGYREIAPYNTNPYAHHWFEKELPRDGVRCAPRRQNENDQARLPR